MQEIKSFLYTYRRPLLATLAVCGAFYLGSAIQQKLGFFAAFSFASYLAAAASVAYYYGQRKAQKSAGPGLVSVGLGSDDDKEAYIAALEGSLESERAVVAAMTESLAPEQI